jgi:hypothetical protein
MSPFWVMLAVVVGSAAAASWAVFRRRHTQRALRIVAKEHGLHFSPVDRFGLAQNVVGKFPVPGAADPLVTDLIYGRSGGGYQYAFAFHYTLGAVRSKRRLTTIVGVTECRGDNGQSAIQSVCLGPSDLPPAAQYLAVLKQLGGPPQIDQPDRLVAYSGDAIGGNVHGAGSHGQLV